MRCRRSCPSNPPKKISPIWGGGRSSVVPKEEEATEGRGAQADRPEGGGPAFVPRRSPEARMWSGARGSAGGPVSMMRGAGSEEGGAGGLPGFAPGPPHSRSPAGPLGKNFRPGID